MCINSACPVPAVRAQPAPSPGLPSWSSTGRESLASKCGWREDGTSGNCTLGRTAGPKCRSNKSYTTKDFTAWPAAASRALEEPQQVCLRGKYPNMSWGGLRHLSFPGKGLWLCGALQTSLGNRGVLEEPTFWPRHFQARGLWWMSELVFSCKWPLWHHRTCINWQVLQESSWHFQSQQLPKASHPASQQFGMWSLCLQQQLPDHTLLRSLGLCCGTVVSLLST